MEINITEMDEYENYDFDLENSNEFNEFNGFNEFNDNFELENNEFIHNNTIQQIPENNFPKKTVRFTEKEINKPMIQSFPKANSRMVRPNSVPVRPQVSYDDILEKMGMYLFNGKLHKNDNQNNQQRTNFNQPGQQKTNFNPPAQQKTNFNPPPELQNSYIYNKYFNDQTQSQDSIRRPRTLSEYRNMLLKDIIQKRRVRELKSKKLVLPTSNINFANNNPGDMNKLFNFSRR